MGIRTSCVFPKVRVYPRHLARAYRGGIIHHEAFEQAIVSFLSFSSFERAQHGTRAGAFFPSARPCSCPFAERMFSRPPVPSLPPLMVIFNEFFQFNERQSALPRRNCAAVFNDDARLSGWRSNLSNAREAASF